MRYRLTPTEFCKIAKYDSMVKADAQQMIQKLTLEVEECQKKIEELTAELEKLQKENAELFRICHEWVPSPSVLPLRVAVKQELFS